MNQAADAVLESIAKNTIKFDEMVEGSVDKWVEIIYTSFKYFFNLAFNLHCEYHENIESQIPGVSSIAIFEVFIGDFCFAKKKLMGKLPFKMLPVFSQVSRLCY